MSLNFIGAALPRLLLCVSGSYRLEIDGEWRTYGANELLMIGQYVDYSEPEMVEGSEVWELVLAVDGIKINRLSSSMEIESLTVAEVSEEMVSLWRAMTENPMPENYLQTYGSALALRLFGVIAEWLQNASWQSDDYKRRRDAQRFFALIEYLSRNLKQPLKKEEVSRHVGMSPATLGRLIRRWQRCTYQQLVLELRLDQARIWLVADFESVETLSERCGFKSVDYFVYSFRRHFGLPPKRMRKLLLQGEVSKCYREGEYKILPEYDPEMGVSFNRGIATVCYFSNESGEARFLYQYKDGRRELISRINNHIRMRFNVKSADLFLLCNEKGEVRSRFLVEDCLCQAICQR